MIRTYSGPGLLGFRTLRDDELERLHQATLKVLQRTGVDVLDGEALHLLKEAGAEVAGSRVRIPSHLVEEALRAAPSQVVLYDRDGKPALDLGGRNVYFGSGADVPHLLDFRTGERRQFTTQDVVDAVRIMDYLPNLDFVGSLGVISDVPTGVSDRHQFRAMVLNSRKPIYYSAHHVDGCRGIVEIASLVAGGEDNLRSHPFIVQDMSAISPLQHGEDAVRKLLFMAETGLPVIYSPSPIPGVSCPVTLAGYLVQGNSETLSGLVIHQLKRPGAPFVYGPGMGPLDMKTMVASYASPEFQISAAAFADLAHYYRLPVYGFGGCTDSKLVDQQAAIESTSWALMNALSGNNLVHDVGYLESGLAGSLEMLVLGDEIIGLVRQIMKGITVDDESLALEVIDRVGPGGDFLSDEHTLQNWRRIWYPELLDRHNHSQWAAAGALTMGDRLQKKTAWIVENHCGEPLPEAVVAGINRVVERAEKQ